MKLVLIKCLSESKFDSERNLMKHLNFKRLEKMFYSKFILKLQTKMFTLSRAASWRVEFTIEAKMSNFTRHEPLEKLRILSRENNKFLLSFFFWLSKMKDSKYFISFATLPELTSKKFISLFSVLLERFFFVMLARGAYRCLKIKLKIKKGILVLGFIRHCVCLLSTS